MSYPLLEVLNVEKKFGGVRALTGLSLSLRRGEILGIIGPNGCGKTSLLNVISGFITPEQGRVVLDGLDLLGKRPHRIAAAGIARTFQETRLIGQMTVLENILLSFRDQPGERLDGLFIRWNKCRAREDRIQEQALAFVDRSGLAGYEDCLADELSYGQQKLLSLICALVADGKLLMLDEPVAGIASAISGTILSLIRAQAHKGKGVLFVEHNFDAIARICDRVIFMDGGASIFAGTPDEVRKEPRVIEAYLGKVISC